VRLEVNQAALIVRVSVGDVPRVHLVAASAESERELIDDLTRRRDDLSRSVAAAVAAALDAHAEAAVA
jgi:hypothetical protein